MAGSRRGLGACCLGAAALAVGLGGWGGTEPLDRAELPKPLADAGTTLEAAGYEVEALDAGPPDLPALRVDAEPPVLIIATEGGSWAGRDIVYALPGALDRADLLDERTAPLQGISCRRTAASGLDIKVTREVAERAGVCRGGSEFVLDSP